MMGARDMSTLEKKINEIFC